MLVSLVTTVTIEDRDAETDREEKRERNTSAPSNRHDRK